MTQRACVSSRPSRGPAWLLAAVFLGLPGALAAQVNGGFEQGNLNGWDIEYGTVTANSAGAIVWGPLNGPLPPGHPPATVITSTSPLAPCQPTRVLPFEGSFCVQLNDLNGLYHATRISQSFLPTAFDLQASGVLSAEFAVMLMEPTDPPGSPPSHPGDSNPGFVAELLINNGYANGGGRYARNAAQAAADGWQLVGACAPPPSINPPEPVWYKRFKACVDLRHLKPTDLITVRLTVWDCSKSGHGGMAWADALKWDYCTAPPSDMVGWWYDMTMRDLAGPAYNDGSLVGNWPSGGCQKVGPALLHNGLAFVSVPDHADLNFPANQDFSIDLWAYPRQRAGRLDPLVDKMCWAPSGFSNGYWFYLDDGNPTLTLASGNTFAHYKGTTVKVALGEWSHLAVTVDRSSLTPRVRFYVNGDLLSGPTAAPLLGDLTSTNTFHIGGPPVGNSFKDLFSGCTDEVEVFRRVLMDDEVQRLATTCNGKCKPCFENLVLAWPTHSLSHPVAAGHMFDVSVSGSEALDVCAVSVRPLGFVGPFTVDVYVTPFSYIGKTTNPAAWTLVGSGGATTPGGTITTAPLVECTLNTPFTLQPGNYGVAVYVRQPGGAASVTYTAYPPLSGPLPPYADPDLTLVPNPASAPGVATSGPFGAVAGNALWNGSLHYTKASVHARCVRPSGGTPYGAGCYQIAASFREFFAANAFDLANSSLSMLYTGSGYTVVANIASFVPPTGPSLGLGDDSSVTVNLTTPLIYGNNTTTMLQISANGCVSPGASNGTNHDPNLAAFLNGAPRWACWHDFAPTPANNVHFEENAGIAYVTWDGVPDFGVPGTSNTFQFQFAANGDVHMVWGNMSGQGNAYLVGWTVGGGAVDGGDVDLSTGTPFSIGAVDVQALRLTAMPAATLGNTVLLTTSNEPSASVGINFLSLGQIPAPGFDLSVLGAPGCKALLDVNQGLGFVISNLGLPGGMSTSLAIPNQASLVGLTIYSQSIWLEPSANAFGILTSNGVALTIGN